LTRWPKEQKICPFVRFADIRQRAGGHFQEHQMAELSGASKALIAVIAIGSIGGAAYTHRQRWLGRDPPRTTTPQPAMPVAGGRKPGELVVGLSQWPGHMGLVVANGGLTTQPGSAAAEAGLDLRIVFLEDSARKNRALADGQVDAVWSTVDELPISVGTFREAGFEVRAFLQIDWSRGGDACVASREVEKVEDVLGRKSSVMMFSPDHLVFEFMVNNSQLTAPQIARVRRDTLFSRDDITYARHLFVEGRVDVACMWEPDVTLALGSRPGAHRLFSTADATELVADVLVARRSWLAGGKSDPGLELARVFFSGVKRATADPAATARLVSTVVPRFRDELGYEQTAAALQWVRWTDVADNAGLFGLEGGTPAFDRLFRQADAIWIDYPQAKIKDRVAPAAVRDDRIVRRIWEESGRPTDVPPVQYQTAMAQNGSPVFTKSISINFDTARAALDTGSMATLNYQLLPQLEMARGMYIRVEGNTDGNGPPDQNQRLSELRAQAIVDYLVSRGIDRARIVARGNGKGQPVASNKTAAGRARNRRTDILFISSVRG
jgi:outer membrane protein OmpA-like peptidoglycan-associated protein